MPTTGVGTDPTEPPPASSVVKSADRVLQVLETLGGTKNSWQFSELARELAIPKSSLHGLLDTLLARRWIDYDPATNRYALGIRSLQLAAGYVNSLSVVQRAGTILDRLSDATEETVQFGRIDGSEVVYLAKRQARHPVQLISDVGKRLPANCTALGKAILAEYDDAEVLTRLPGTLPQLTSRSISTREAFLANLNETRARGFAIDNEEAIDDIICIAVAIRPSSGPVTEAISVSIPKYRLVGSDTEQTVTQLLLEARADLAI